MDNIFTSLSNPVEAPVAESVKDDERKAKINEMKAAFKEALMTDPTLKDRIQSLSGSLEVVNSLGFGDAGNIIVDKSTPEGKLQPTSQIVGYRVRNIGTTPIKYITEVYTKDATGKYVGTKVEKVLEPGQTADLTRQYMTILCSQPEFSFTLANGKIVRGSAKKVNSIKEELESYYFRFDKETGKNVNDDEVKLNVGMKVDGKWVVKPEFVEAFGFLNNPKETAKGGRKASVERQFSAQDIAANYVNKLIKEAGIL